MRTQSLPSPNPTLVLGYFLPVSLFLAHLLTSSPIFTATPTPSVATPRRPLLVSVAVAPLPPATLRGRHALRGVYREPAGMAVAALGTGGKWGSAAFAKAYGGSVKELRVLALLREVYDAPILKPILPYDPNALVLTVPLAGGARGDGEAQPRAAPRLLDFFPMHVCVRPVLPNLLKVLEDPVHKAQLLHGYARAKALFALVRGRPRIDVPLLMSYTKHPRPGGSDALGKPSTEGETDPWLAIAVRALYYSAQRFGRTPPGGAIGAQGWARARWMVRSLRARRGR
ncbi:hypothetical protein FB451DRAFT_1403503 [Mycena latifolia]|nr:hypothetical protein FB451DRAFT_1403503 [Mycena latifolia]